MVALAPYWARPAASAAGESVGVEETLPLVSCAACARVLADAADGSVPYNVSLVNYGSTHDSVGLAGQAEIASTDGHLL